MSSVQSKASVKLPSNGKLFGDRFRPHFRLASHAGIDTWRATDEDDGADVVIKVCQRSAIPHRVVQRLEYESEIARDLAQPRLLVTKLWGTSDDLFFWVRPYVSGTSVAEMLAILTLDPKATLVFARGILSLLEKGHERGLLHRNLKPSNVIFTQGYDAPTLVDTGFGRNGQWPVEEMSSDFTAIQYLSPEQCGTLRCGVDERSDLYSFGAIMYASLSGCPPIVAASMGELLRQQVVSRPPPLRSLGLDIPRALDDVIQRLLCKDPRDRYQSASAVSADLRLIEGALIEGSAAAEIVIGGADARRTLAEPAFVGRASELQRLVAFCDHAHAGDGGLLLLESESGGGKTRLLDELATVVRGHGGLVLRAHAVGEGAPRPFAMLEGIASAIAGESDANPAWRSVLRTKVEELGPSTLVALRSLKLLHADVAPAPQNTTVVHEGEALVSLSGFLLDLGTEDQPVVLVFDDCQWIDQQTLQLLTTLQTRLAADHEQSFHTAVIVAFQSEDVSAGHSLRLLSARDHIALYPFSGDEISALIHSMAGRSIPPEAVDTILSLSAGNPFVAVSVLRGMVEGGALRPDAHGWCIDESAMAALQSSEHMAALVTGRLDRLPPDLQRLLAVSAVIGIEFAFDDAASMAGVSLAVAIKGFAQARRRHLIWMTSDGMHGVLVHHKLRESLLSTLDANEYRALHLAAARRCEAGDKNVFDLAYHLGAAGEHEAVLPYALQAAEQALGRNAPAVAESYYRMAEKASELTEHHCRLQIVEGIGDVLARQGKCAAAQTQLEKALSLATEHVDRARVQGRLAAIAFKCGDMVRSRSLNLQALRALGFVIPSHTLRVVPRLATEMARHVWHQMVHEPIARRPQLKAGSREQVLISLLVQTLRSDWCGVPRVVVYWLVLRLGNLVARFAPTKDLGEAYVCLSTTLRGSPRFHVWSSLMRRAEAFERDIGDALGRVWASRMKGVSRYSASLYREAHESLREAAHLLDTAGDHEAAAQSRLGSAFCLYRLGNLKQAVETAESVYHAGVGLDDARIAAGALEVWAKASGGRVSATLAQAELARPIVCSRNRVAIMQAEGVRLLFEQRYGEAVLAFREALASGRRVGQFGGEMSSPRCWLATALRALLEHTPSYDAGKRRCLLDELGSVTKAAVRQARRYHNDLPHALRERALYLASMGRTQAAFNALDRGVNLATSQHATLEHALSLMARGQLAVAVDRVSGDQDLAVAGRTLMELGAEWALDLDIGAGIGVANNAVTPSLVDRFRGVLECSRRIASALSEEAIYLAVQEAVLILLRPEAWVVLEAPNDDVTPLRVIGGSSSAQPRRLVTSAIELGHPILGDDSEDAVPLSLANRRRSVLCAPIFARGRPVACFCAVHEHLPELFGNEELRLAEHIATVAGAALENAEGFARVESLSRSLEQRVAERTAALAEANRELDNKVQELVATHADLVRAEKLAFAGGLASGIAHEINNPLAAMRANLEVLREYSMDIGRLWVAAESTVSYLQADGSPQAQRLVSSLIGEYPGTERDQAVTEINDIINDMLDSAQRIADLVVGFRRLARTPETLVAETVALKPMLETCLAELMHAPRVAALPFVVELEDQEVVAVAADLKAAMSNILACAVEHFISSGDTTLGKLVVRMGRDEDNRYIRVYLPLLRLSPEERARLFDPHVALDAIETQRMRLDLRLAIAYQLLHRMNAAFSVSGDDLGGTVFDVRFDAHRLARTP